MNDFNHDEIWKIAQHVEAHPDDNEARWELAKKMYAKWEYRHALEHLQLLMNVWPDRPNVYRYLAAAYYRLSRYDDALETLSAAIEKWPMEIGLREQLARVLEADGRKPDAARIWEEIARLKPDHEFAAKAARALMNQAVTADPTPAIGEKFSSGPVSLSADEVQCPGCGASNEPDFSRCWKCHASLAPSSTSEISAGEDDPRDESAESHDFWPLIAGFSILGLLTVALYLTLRGFFPSEVPNAAMAVPITLGRFLAETLAMTRLITGLAALILWPVVLRLVATLLALNSVSATRLDVLGVFLALLAYDCTWLPSPLVLYTPLAPAVCSIVLLPLACGVRIKQGLLLWAIQGTVVATALLALLAAQQGFTLLTETPALYRFAHERPAKGTRTRFNRDLLTPVRLGLRWESSGSPWLDEHARTVGVLVESKSPEKQLVLEVEDTGLYRQLAGAENALQWPRAQAGMNQVLTIESAETVEVAVTIRSVLRFKASLLK